MATEIPHTRWITERTVRSGFTLVEMLIVSTLFALVIALTLPALSSTRESVQSVICQSNLRNIYTGWVIGIDANNGKIPYTFSITATQRPRWNDLLDEVFPDSKSIHGNNAKTHGACPTIQSTYRPMFYPVARWGYAVNYNWDSNRSELNETKKWDDVAHPNLYPIFMDPEVYPFTGGFLAAGGAPNTTNPALKTWGLGTPHYDGTHSNIVFASGSTKSVTLVDVLAEATAQTQFRWFDNR